MRLTFFLLNDVAEYTSFLASEVLTSSPKFVEHASGHKHGRGHLRGRMAELLSRILAVVLEQADVLDPGISLQVEDPLGGETKKVSDLFVTRRPQMPVMVRILDQHLVRADGVHAIVYPVAPAAGLAFDAIQRLGMNDGAC